MPGSITCRKSCTRSRCVHDVEDSDDHVEFAMQETQDRLKALEQFGITTKNTISLRPTDSSQIETESNARKSISMIFVLVTCSMLSPNLRQVRRPNLWQIRVTPLDTIPMWMRRIAIRSWMRHIAICFSTHWCWRTELLQLIPLNRVTVNFRAPIERCTITVRATWLHTWLWKLHRALVVVHRLLLWRMSCWRRIHIRWLRAM
jgi:hypothetical protein